MANLIDMEYEDLLQFKKTLTTQLGLVDSKLKAVNQVLSKQYEGICGICETSKFAYNDLPIGWGWLVDDTHHMLLCDKCIAKWEDRWVVCKTTRGGEI